MSKRIDPWLQLYVVLALVCYAFIIGYLLGSDEKAPQTAPVVAVLRVKRDDDEVSEIDVASSDLAYNAPEGQGDDNG